MEDNTLIAEFMGLNIDKGVQSDYMEYELRYHKSWDWLMPVVDKIDEVSDENILFKIEHNRAFIEDIENYHVFIDVIANSRLEATYKGVVEFIKQYNNED